MKLSTLLTSSGSLAVGYVLGSAAGRARYQQIKTAANNLLRHPKVQQVAFDLADKAKTSAQRLPGPAAPIVDKAATRVQDKLTHPANTTTSVPSDPVPNPTAVSTTPVTGTPR